MKYALIFCLILICFQTTIGEASDDREVLAMKEWVTSNAIRLEDVTPQGSLKDLEPMKKILQEVRIVGLGEGTHGTREFFQFKHKMLRFLVEEMGYTIFGMEAGYPECLRINEYVLGLGADSDLDEIINSTLAEVWRTEEVRDLIRWMREHNKTAGSKIKFAGFDVQSSARAIEIVASYLKRVAPESVASAEAVFRLADPATGPKNRSYLAYMAYKKYSRAKKEEIRTGLLKVIGVLSFGEREMIRRTSGPEYTLAVACARIILQGHHTRAGEEEDLRDRYMAETIEHILNQEENGARMVLWGHNMHLADSKELFVRMGQHLRQRFGSQYYVIGFCFDRGTFLAGDEDALESAKSPEEALKVPMKSFPISSAPEGSLSWYFAQAKLGNVLLDLRSAIPASLSSLLERTMLIRQIGAGFSTKWDEEEFSVPGKMKEYDAILFIENTTASRPISVAEFY